MANLTTPVAGGTKLATILVGDEHITKNALTDHTGADVLGLVAADPAANTLLGRLKAIADGISTLAGHVDGLEALATMLNGFVDGIEGLIGTTNTSLAAIGGYVDGLEALATSLNGYVDGLETLQGTTNTTLTTLNGYVDGLEALTTAMSAKLPATLGAKTGANSLSVVPASDATFALAASETVVGAVAGTSDLVAVTLTLDTAIYASGDVLAETQVIANAVRINGGQAMMQSVLVIDEDDQGQPFDLLFLSANSSLGVENAVPSITDAGARDVLGLVPVATTDFVDLGGARIATVRNIGLMLEAAAGSRDLYVAAIARGAGTYTATGLKLRLGLIWS